MVKQFPSQPKRLVDERLISKSIFKFGIKEQSRSAQVEERKKSTGNEQPPNNDSDSKSNSGSTPSNIYQSSKFLGFPKPRRTLTIYEPKLPLIGYGISKSQAAKKQRGMSRYLQKSKIKKEKSVRRILKGQLKQFLLLLKNRYYVIVVDTKGYDFEKETSWQRTQTFLKRIRFMVTEGFYKKTLYTFLEDKLEDCSPEKEEKFLKSLQIELYDNYINQIYKALTYPKAIQFHCENFLYLKAVELDKPGKGIDLLHKLNNKFSLQFDDFLKPKYSMPEVVDNLLFFTIEAVCDEHRAMKKLYGALRNEHIKRLSGESDYVHFYTNVNEISTCDFVSNYLNIIHQQPKLDLEGYNVVSDYDDEDEEEDSLTS